MNLTLSYATQYNGIFISPTSNDVEVTEEMEKVFDEVSDTLPTFIDRWTKDNWDHDLTFDQEIELCRMAADIVRSVIPNPVVEFEYDNYSSFNS